ncbi:ferredoxin [Pseudonocardia pini]|uniref:ferredoxin n=1 Tax=Pseudonocardia pini TaxID=2758030 RepID=UPI0015F0395A|nr:ferredoxin [Pseudonocardia pini]
MSLRITIDHDRCTGHGRCYMLAPELFDADDEGRPFLLDADPGDHPAEARSAAENCPEGAITVSESVRSGS